MYSNPRIKQGHIPCNAVKQAMKKLLCPITFSLPVDPVIAEDGNVYERSAIEEWLKQQHKSPVTNLKMGTRLLPALQVTGLSLIHI